MRLFDEYDDDDPADRDQVRCKRCDSEDVRWRQQGGRWVLFSLQPGVVHRCPVPRVTDEFEPVKE